VVTQHLDLVISVDLRIADLAVALDIIAATDVGSLSARLAVISDRRPIQADQEPRLVVRRRASQKQAERVRPGDY
jgi:hypothetical protein